MILLQNTIEQMIIPVLAVNVLYHTCKDYCVCMVWTLCTHLYKPCACQHKYAHELYITHIAIRHYAICLYKCTE